jgi:hypothetical protein
LISRHNSVGHYALIKGSLVCMAAELLVLLDRLIADEF